MRIRILAADETGQWTLCFIEEEYHVFVAFSPPAGTPDPLEGMTVEEFLIRRPRDQLQATARQTLTHFLRSLTT